MHVGLLNMFKKGSRTANIVGSAILCLALLALASSPAAAWPDSVLQINPSDDTMVGEYNPDDTTSGISINVIVSPSSITRGYLKFPLELPDNAVITSAKLNLYHENGRGESRTCDVHRVTENWSEGTATWNNQPTYIASRTADLSFDPTDYSKWRSWVVTSDIDSTALADGWVSWCVKYRNEGSSYGGPHWSFYTKENPENSPYLEITYNVPPTLSGGSVVPTTSEWEASFTYDITYTDADNDLPTTYPRLFIDGENVGRATTEKDPGDQDTTDGKVYKYVLETTSENMGIHSFYFYVEDTLHGFSARYPSTGSQDGPTVTKRSVSLTCDVDNGAPEPGQQITFSGYLKNSKGLALAQRTVQLYMDGSDTGLTAVTDNSGFYSISTAAPENRGLFSYKVHFAEEALYSSAQSSAASVSTEVPGAVPELPLAWIAGIAIVAVAVCVGIFVKIRK